MKQMQRILFVFLAFPLLLTACKSNPDPINPDPTPDTFHADDFPALDNNPPANLSITWSNTARKISHTTYSAEYGRLEKLRGDTLLFTYHFGPQGQEWDNIALRKSFDGGQNWSEAEIIMADNNPNYYGFANPDLEVLKNNWILMAFTGRGNPDDNAHDNIQIRISKDRGQTWGAPQIVATGRSWEPAIVQLPDGEIEIFYSSEAKWWTGIGSANVQQEILMVSSRDNGATWTSPRQVAYTGGMRDGMPVPLVLQDNKGIVLAIESVNNTRSPWIVWSSRSASWNYREPGTSQNGRRWLATPENIWGGAPYLIQLPGGETLLACQDRGGRAIGSDWRKNTMLVLVGNSVAQNFRNISYPWPDLPLNEGAYYSSLFYKDAQTLVLVTTRNYPDGHSEIYWKEGRITR
jgi:hypothetical protein